MAMRGTLTATQQVGLCSTSADSNQVAQFHNHQHLAFAGVMFYEAVQSTAVDVGEAALAATALAYTQVRQCLSSTQQQSASLAKPAW